MEETPQTAQPMPVPAAPVTPEIPASAPLPEPVPPVVATKKSSKTAWILAAFLLILIAAAVIYAYTQGLLNFGATTSAPKEDSTAIEQELNTIDSELTKIDSDLSQIESDSAGF